MNWDDECTDFGKPEERDITDKIRTLSGTTIGDLVSYLTYTIELGNFSIREFPNIDEPRVLPLYKFFSVFILCCIHPFY